MLVLYLSSVASEDLSIGSSSVVQDYDYGGDDNFPPGFGDFPDDMFPDDPLDSGNSDPDSGNSDPDAGSGQGSSDPTDPSGGGSGGDPPRRKRSIHHHDGSNHNKTGKTKSHHKLKRTNSASSALGKGSLILSLVSITQIPYGLFEDLLQFSSTLQISQ